LTILLRSNARRRRKREVADAARQSALTQEAQLAELRGRLTSIAEMTAAGEARLGESLNQRLDQVSARLGDGLLASQARMSDSLDRLSRRLGEDLTVTSNRLSGNLTDAATRTTETLGALHERMALLDQAQARLSELASEVVSLRNVLADRQARGAFGQGRMEAIIEDGLPHGAYEFQATLSNGRRPDCLVRLSKSATPLVIDAKFPLDAFEALRTAQSGEETEAATRRAREAVMRHVTDIAEKYLIPSEINERFPDIVQRANRSCVVIVSPNMLMLAVQTMQAILKDVRMREQAGLIRREVGLLMEM
jgi:DNA recombination protein RmuC